MATSSGGSGNGTALLLLVLSAALVTAGVAGVIITVQRFARNQIPNTRSVKVEPSVSQTVDAGITLSTSTEPEPAPVVPASVPDPVPVTVENSPSLEAVDTLTRTLNDRHRACRMPWNPGEFASITVCRRARDRYSLTIQGATANGCFRRALAPIVASLAPETGCTTYTIPMK